MARCLPAAYKKKSKASHPLRSTTSSSVAVQTILHRPWSGWGDSPFALCLSEKNKMERTPSVRFLKTKRRGYCEGTEIKTLQITLQIQRNAAPSDRRWNGAVAHCLQPSPNKHASSSQTKAGGSPVVFRQTSLQIYNSKAISPYMFFIRYHSSSSLTAADPRLTYSNPAVCQRRVPKLNADRSKCEKQKRTPFLTTTQHTTRKHCDDAPPYRLNTYIHVHMLFYVAGCAAPIDHLTPTLFPPTFPTFRARMFTTRDTRGTKKGTHGKIRENKAQRGERRHRVGRAHHNSNKKKQSTTRRQSGPKLAYRETRFTKEERR